MRKKAKHRVSHNSSRKTTHGGRIYGHAVKRIRRRRETTKSVLYPTVRVAIAVAIVIPSRRTVTVVLLAGAGAEDTAHDSTNNHEEGDRDGDFEPIPLWSCSAPRGDVTGGFVVVRVPGAVRRSGSRLLRAVVVVICFCGHVSRLVVPWLLAEGNDYDQRESMVD